MRVPTVFCIVKFLCVVRLASVSRGPFVYQVRLKAGIGVLHVAVLAVV